MLAAQRMMLAAHTCNPGLLTLPYFNTFTGSFDTTWVSCDGSTWVYDGSGDLQCTNLAGNTPAVLQADAGTDDIDITITWGNNPSTFDFAGFYFNWLDNNNYHMIRGDSGGLFAYETVAGVTTLLGLVGAVQTGRSVRVILKAGYLFVFEDTGSGFGSGVIAVYKTSTITGGTKVGFFTHVTGNLFRDITVQAPLYYRNVGSVGTGTTVVDDAGSQRQVTMMRINTDGGSAGPQQWSTQMNAINPTSPFPRAQWQKADSTAASDYQDDDDGTAQHISNFGLGNTGGAGIWYASLTYGQFWKVLQSSDGVTWTDVDSTRSLSHGAELATSTFWHFSTTGRTSWDNCQVWAFTP